MKTKYFIFAAFAGTLLAAASCERDGLQTLSETPNLPQEKFNYANQPLPAHVVNTNDMSAATNPITDAGATLGRVLFYDSKLSLNNTISCNSCHAQRLAFADGLQFSQGFESHFTKRNSPGFSNLKSANSFFWDGRASSMEMQATMPIADHIEMGMERFDHLAQKLSKVDYYAPLFTEAFGDATITQDRLAKALSQFLRSIVSYRSKYDQGVVTNFSNFSAMELMGKDLFQRSKCTSCHAMEFDFHDWGGWANIGLDSVYTDLGAASWTSNTFDQGAFKVPSLRNIALTAPYMHDGRFATLDEVVEHYNSQVKPVSNLDFRLTNLYGDSTNTITNGGGIIGFPIDPLPGGGFGNGQPRKLRLSAVQKQAIVAFLKTLTDEELTRDVKFSNPFK